MTKNIRPKPSPRRGNPLPHGVSWSGRATAAGADLEFGRFRVLLRRRQLLADGVPVELGARAFDLLVALLEADEALVTKQELMSRVWPGLVVSKENIKVQVSSLRKALGADRDVILTDFGRGIASLACSPRMLRRRLVNVTSDQSRGPADLCLHGTAGDRSDGVRLELGPSRTLIPASGDSQMW